MVFAHKKGIAGQVLLNASSSMAAYTVLSNGVRNVYVYDVRENKSRRVARYKLPPWIIDHSADPYPILSWHPNGHDLYVVAPRKGKITITSDSPEGRRLDRMSLDGVDGITAFQPLGNNEFLMAAYRKAQQDIVIYNDNKARFQPLTDDEYDDLQPVLGADRKDLVLVSERPEKFETVKKISHWRRLQEGYPIPWPVPHTRS